MTIVDSGYPAATPATETWRRPWSGISWPAILGGAAVSCALTLLMLAFGAGLGLSVVSPWGGSGVSATTFKIGTGIYFLVVAMIASGLGGHVTGRLRHRYAGVHPNEVYFRDTANGFVAWAVATLIGVTALSSIATGIVGGAATGAIAAAPQATSTAAPYIDRLLRIDSASPAPAPAPAGNGDADTQVRGELAALLMPSLSGRSDLAAADRTYVNRVVARRTGLSEADSEQRVNAVLTQAKSDLDAARKAALQLSLWLAASLLLGAFASAIAAAEAGEIRDRNWNVVSEY